MQLNNIKRQHKNKSAKPRVGRGGKRGTTSGRGTKGQKSRSGHRIRPAIRDYIQRLPKLRGIKNIGRGITTAEVSLNSLGKITAPEITLKVLKEHKLASREATKAKILAGKAFTRKIVVKGLGVSAGARKQIEAAGGKVE